MHISNMYVKYLSVRSVQKVHCAFSYRKLNQMFRVFFSFIFFYFLPLQRDVNSCAGRLRVLFVPLLVTLFLFFFVFSLAVYLFLFLFYFSFNSLLPFHFAYIKRSLPARALVLSPSLSFSLAAVSVFDCAFSAAAAAAF